MFLGGGSSKLKMRAVNMKDKGPKKLYSKKEKKKHQRCGFNFFDVGDKVQLASLFIRFSVHELGDDVHEREQNQREVVCNKVGGGPISLEKYRPSAELYISKLERNSEESSPNIRRRRECLRSLRTKPRKAATCCRKEDPCD